MATTLTARAEPRPYEEFLIANTLESDSGQETLMDTINHLSKERNQLQTRLAQHPWSDHEAAARIQAISAKLEACWAEVRRIRAARRVELEEALGIDPSLLEQEQRRRRHLEAGHSTRNQHRRQARLILAPAS